MSILPRHRGAASNVGALAHCGPYTHGHRTPHYGDTYQYDDPCANRDLPAHGGTYKDTLPG